MVDKKKFELEYTLKTSPKIVFKRFGTASGLAEWFADDVHREGDIFTFIWDGSKEKAKLLGYKYPEYVRFHWLEEEEKTFFEFRLQVDELTNDLALIIVDFADEDEIDESVKMWDAQIEELKHNLGM